MHASGWESESKACDMWFNMPASQKASERWACFFTANHLASAPGRALQVSCPPAIAFCCSFAAEEHALIGVWLQGALGVPRGAGVRSPGQAEASGLPIDEMNSELSRTLLDGTCIPTNRTPLQATF